MKHFRHRIYEIIQPARPGDTLSHIIDIVILGCIIGSTVLSFMATFNLSPQTQKYCDGTDSIITIIFVCEYLARLLTADIRTPHLGPFRSVLKFIIHPMALIDLCAILPNLLPYLFPCSLSFLRLLRIFRLLRLGKLGRYTGAFRAIQTILADKAKELMVSLFSTGILLIISSLLIYHAEHEVQPDIFKNAFSGLWWAIATLTTIGYGDIYPITVFGKVLAALMAILGIGMVAVPTGILSGAYLEYLEKNRVSNHQHSPIEYCPYCGKKLPESKP